MSDLSSRLREVYAATGQDYLQWAADTLDKRDAEIERLREELAVWESVFPDIAPESVQPDRSTLLKESTRLREENAALRKMLLEAADEIADWGAYAGEYFQSKHDLTGTIKRVQDAAKENSDE